VPGQGGRYVGRMLLTTLVDDRGAHSWHPNTRQTGLRLAAQGKEGFHG